MGEIPIKLLKITKIQCFLSSTNLKNGQVCALHRVSTTLIEKILKLNNYKPIFVE